MEQQLESILKKIETEKYILSLKHYLANIESEQFKMLDHLSNTLQRLKLDEQSIITAFLYATIDKSKLDYEELSADFDREITSLLKALNTVESTKSQNGEMSYEEIRSMLFAMSKDIRALIILLAYVEYKIKNVYYFYPDEHLRSIFVRAVQEIYVPISGRLGLNDIKNDMEDSCFKYFDPEIFEKLGSEEALNKEKRQRAVDAAMKKINEMLAEMNIEAKVLGRQKHLASVYKKMQKKEINLAQIYDLVAVRVIVKTLEQCYEVLGKINTAFVILPERFKDYIANPKPNGYQSLHTCIIGENNRPIEVQIRTEQMHELCEYGIAAHWMYKERLEKTNEIDEKMNWFRKIIEENKDFSDEEFIENIKTDLFVYEIFVQTPHGKIIKFPLGANCIDFAYAIHTDVGNQCVGAKINGKIRPLNTALENGDVCEILTSQKSKGPSRDWLKLVKTSAARQKISAFFRKELVEENIKLGKTMLEKACKDKNLDFAETTKIARLQPVFKKYSISKLDELFAAIGYGSLTTEKVINRIEGKENQRNLKHYTTNKIDSQSIIVDGQNGMLTRFAGCCSPIPGDQIIGFVSKGLGVTIHRADCQNLKFLEKNRFIEAHWAEDLRENYKTKIRIITNVDFSVSEITKVLEILKINLNELNIKAHVGERKEVNISINIASTQLLTDLLHDLRQLPAVISAIRVA